MKAIILFLSVLSLSNIVNAAPVQYHFISDFDPEIDFIIQVDFSQDGHFINGDGSPGAFDSSRNTFLAEYISGNYSLATSTNQFQLFYGEEGLTPEGTFGCVNVLNSLSVCDDLDLGFGGVASWRVGNLRLLTLGNSMGSLQTEVKLVSISAVPLPASIIFMLSGLITMMSFYRKKI